MHKVTATLILGLSAAFPAVAGAEEPGSRPTREFVQAIGQSDAFEVAEGQTALAATINPEIRAFAQQMIHDHGETAHAMVAATMRSGLAPPPRGMSADQAQMLGALQSLNGREFDEAYLRQQVLAHNSALAVVSAYAASGDDPAVRQAAAAAAPVISSHLAMAEQMRARPGGS